MARKPLAGKRAFYAMGQSDKTRHMPFSYQAKNQAPGCWPDWAKVAYLRGWHGLNQT